MNWLISLLDRVKSKLFGGYTGKIRYVVDVSCVGDEIQCSYKTAVFKDGILQGEPEDS